MALPEVLERVRGARASTRPAGALRCRGAYDADRGAMSGGVDSSVAAALLVEQGHEVVGLTMRLYDAAAREPTGRAGTCCSPAEIDQAARLCAARDPALHGRRAGALRGRGDRRLRARLRGRAHAEPVRPLQRARQVRAAAGAGAGARGRSCWRPGTTRAATTAGCGGRSTTARIRATSCSPWACRRWRRCASRSGPGTRSRSGRRRGRSGSPTRTRPTARSCASSAGAITRRWSRRGRRRWASIVGRARAGADRRRGGRGDRAARGGPPGHDRPAPRAAGRRERAALRAARAPGARAVVVGDAAALQVRRARDRGLSPAGAARRARRCARRCRSGTAGDRRRRRSSSTGRGRGCASTSRSGRRPRAGGGGLRRRAGARRRLDRGMNMASGTGDDGLRIRGRSALGCSATARRSGGRSEALAPLAARLGHRFAPPGAAAGRADPAVVGQRAPGRGLAGNACLEFLGDAVLGLVTADALWQRFPDLAEGTLTRLRASLVSEASLAAAAEAIGLGDLFVGRGDRKTASSSATPGPPGGRARGGARGGLPRRARGGRDPLAAAGAVLDGAARGARADAAPEDDGVDAKSRLQALVQAATAGRRSYEAGRRAAEGAAAGVAGAGDADMARWTGAGAGQRRGRQPARGGARGGARARGLIRELSVGLRWPGGRS
jgi:ribonuclease-3